jgi:nicotinamidase-related amidase
MVVEVAGIASRCRLSGMDTAAALDRSRTAALVLDYQPTVFARMVKEPLEPLLERAAQAIDTLRQRSVPVIYVTLGYRAGYPEVSGNNQLVSSFREQGLFRLGSTDTAVHPSVAPRPDEVQIVKHRTNAFYGTDLSIVLAARKIDTLILFGVATGGAVLSTVRHAFDADYRLFVVRDCCADPDPEVERVLLEKVLPRQANVIALTELPALLAG